VRFHHARQRGVLAGIGAVPAYGSHMHRVSNATSGAVIAERLRTADTHWTRLRGLLGTRRLEPGDGLWIKPCSQVHMIGMRYAIDVVFLDAEHRVVRAIAGLAPGKISPRVRAASSVLELPEGTLARAGLHEGGRLVITGDGQVQPRSVVDAVGAALCNLGVSAVYVVFAAVHIAAARRTGQWASTVPIVIQETLLAGLFLIRRRTSATSSRPFDWLVVVAGTVLPLLLRPLDRVGSLNWLGQAAQLGGLLVALCAFAFRGRRVGVVAASRRVKTGGLYRVVRHPIDAAHMMVFFGYVACYPSLRNAVIVGITLCLFNARVIVEERFLAAHDPAYREYLRQTRWRLVPYLY
jgi:protein-S-isoprenylcysteine O-methyltransferase Ste14/uncharacterized membrane protein (UPF0127 family)